MCICSLSFYFSPLLPQLLYFPFALSNRPIPGHLSISSFFFSQSLNHRLHVSALSPLLLLPLLHTGTAPLSNLTFSIMAHYMAGRQTGWLTGQSVSAAGQSVYCPSLQLSLLPFSQSVSVLFTASHSYDYPFAHAGTAKGRAYSATHFYSHFNFSLVTALSVFVLAFNSI